MTVRSCDDGGLLVNAKTRLPTDVCEYFRKETRVLVGCNRLRCTRCNEWVRNAPRLSLKTGVPRDVGVLYDAESWEGLPFVEESGRFRLYACRCTVWEAGANDTIKNDHDSASEPDVPWICAGHSVPDLPVSLGGLTIAVDTDCVQLVGKILAGTCPRALGTGPGSLDDGPSLWLGWLYTYLDGLALADRFSAAIGERVADPDPVTVGRALCFFLRFPKAVGYERVVARAEAAPQRAAVGYGIPEYYDALTIWDVLVARLDQRSQPLDALDERTMEVVRNVLVLPLSSLSHDNLGSPPSGTAQRTDVVVHTFTRVVTKAFNDADLRLWIADHIVKLDAAAKGRWRQYMDLLADWHRKPELGHLIVSAGMRLIEGRVVGVAEFREWMNGLRANHGWVDDAWVLPLTSVLEEHDPAT
jgi:hypothetical protein